MLNQALTYLNPIERLGVKRYSFVFPLIANLALIILSELYAYGIARDPMGVGVYIIFLNVAFIIYFAFRDGIRGGFISSVFSIVYYFYIIYTRHFKGAQFNSGIDTTIILGVLYFLLAGIIGWLKQTIDALIEREADEKRRLQAIVDQLPVGVLITDNNGRLTHRNKQIDAILGMKMPLGFRIGKDTLTNNTIDGKLINPSHAPLAQALAKGKSVVGKEFVFERSDKKHVFLQISSSPIYNKNGKIIAAASITNDITPLKEMEARKDDFVNMASHELKTPITSMKLYIDLLLKKLKTHEDERTVKTLNGIKYQTEKLQELVSDLLDVSRIQTGKLTFKKETFKINTLIEETVDGLQGMSPHNINYITKTPVIVYADRFRIYQVLTNLITNAIKYSPGKEAIIIRLKRANGKAIVSIQDFGLGITKEEQSKIFERLYQVIDSKEKTFPGLGMGLYISKEIIKRHRGTIWVESTKGKGSTFYFSLPMGSKV